MGNRKNIIPRFAICISDEEDALTLHKIYRVLSDEDAKEVDYVRVIDDEGEDYLYPRDNFILVNFPPEIEKVLLRASKNFD